ncbi:MAG: PAS domain-containing protein [Proteobacteria bacterium]|nr:PAS domain-containing protein [Pseudomonadota bacterium]
MHEDQADGPASPRTERRLRWLVMAPPLLVLALLCCLAVGSLQMLGAARAYVAGESLWSKARGSAVQALEDFVQSGDARDLIRFEVALGVPDGDRLAREAMMGSPVDVDAARRGLLAGGNQAADIDGMVTLFRLFGDSWIFRDSLQAWVAGDQLLAELRQVADHVQHAPPNAPEGERAALRGRIRDLNQRLLAQEKRFIGSLNAAAHLTERILQVSLLAATLLMAATYALIAHRSLRRRERHAQAVQQAQERWELAVAASGLGLFDLDVERDRYTLDARAAELNGLPAQALTLARQALRQCAHPDDRDATARLLDEAIQQGHIVALRYRVIRPDGGVRHIESTGRVARHGGLHLMGVLRDVTEEVAQAQATSQRDAAERVAAAQRIFLSRLSHELRTPLNAILGFAQLLDMDRSTGLSAPQHQQVQWILNAGRQLLGLVEDVLDLSKVEAGEVTMRPRALALQQVLRECLPLVETVRQERQVQVTDDLPAEPLSVWADPQRLQQVLINLLSNGCKYNRPGGQLRVSARTDGADIVVDIADSGIGLTPAEQAELFQPFRRPARASANIEGTGLGLYIVQQLLQRMQGSISVRSQAGEGSCFTLRLPAAAAHNPSSDNH